MTFHSKLTYANVASTAALAIALSGSAYAAATVTSANIANHTIKDADVKKNSLSAAVNESKLGQVPRASDADKVDGLDAAALKVRCPSGTKLVAGLCVETQARVAPNNATLGDDSQACADTGRRMVSMTELLAAVRTDGVSLAAINEYTLSYYGNGTSFPESTLVLTPSFSVLEADSVTLSDPHAFRCVTGPLN